MGEKKTTEQFVKEAQMIHNGLYDYSLTEYTGSKINVTIICPHHGEFKQRPSHHLDGSGCPKCARERSRNANRIDTQEFIKRARRIHNETYDYSKVKYINSRTRVSITCRQHGEFAQTPNDHLSGYGCWECGKIKIGQSHRKTKKQFVIDAMNIHGDKYDYSLVEYVNTKTEVQIICPEHSLFQQQPIAHLQGSGCPACGEKRRLESRRKPLAQFVAEASDVHGGRYDYGKTKYRNAFSKIVVGCPKHGDFKITPHNHLWGGGCPKCYYASRGEMRVAQALDYLGVNFESQKRFDKCKDLCLLPFDFYWQIAESSFLLEYQGEQHYRPIDHFGGKEAFQSLTARDAIKKTFAKENGFHLIVIPYWNFDKITQIIISEIESVTGFSVDQIAATRPERQKREIDFICGYQLPLVY